MATSTVSARVWKLMTLVALSGVVVACQQQPAPGNRATEAAAARAAEAAQPKAVSQGQKLVISVDGDKNADSQGSWVHVRVSQAGTNLAPAEGLCSASDCNPGKGFSQTDPGVYVYSFTPVAGPQTLTFLVDKMAAPVLSFSTTGVSGKVKVSWDGQERVYDLYRPQGDGVQHPPIKLDQPLPEAY